MNLPEYQGLLAGYAAAMFGWLLIHRFWPGLWPARRAETWQSPGREFGLAVLAALAVVGVGQLYQRGWLLSGAGNRGALLDNVDQVLIFAPMLLLLALRRQSLATAWLPLDRVWARLAVGLLLAVSALFAFVLAVASPDLWPDLMKSVYQGPNARYALHVLLEDLSIAILFVRAAAALKRPWLVALIVAFLFAAGHIPGALTDGAGLAELLPLLLDVGLGVFVLLVVSRSADIWWFWCVHFALDMTQFWR